jgi:hypothetical protein
MSPYRRVGKCVHHENPDGSVGAKKGCSTSVEGAKAYLRALYSHTTDIPKKKKK